MKSIAWLSAALILALSISASRALADDSAIDFAGSYTQGPATAPQARIILIPVHPPANFFGQLFFGGKLYRLTGDVDNGTLRGDFTDMQRRQYPFTATLQDDTLDFTAGNTDIKLTADKPLGPPTAPQPSAKPPTDHPGALVFLQQIPAWLTPGTRVTYRLRSASIPGSQYKLLPDPDGEVEDPSGHRFSLNDNTLGQASDGLNVWDVLAIADPHTIASAETTFFIGMNKPGQITPGMGGYTPGNGVMPLARTPLQMMDPASLAAAPQSVTPQRSVFRSQFKVGNKTLSSLSIIFHTPDTYIAAIYHLDTGMCLHYGATSHGPPPPRIEGVPGARLGDIAIGITDMIDVRRIQTPWTNSAIPQALRAAKRLVYQGARRGGLPSTNATLTNIIKFHDATDAYMPYSFTHIEQSQGFGGQPGFLQPQLVTEHVTAPASLMPFAIDPAVLATLQNGQVIDDDPDIQYRTSVTSVGPDNQGRNVVVISQISTGNTQNPRTDLIYDAASGMLVEQDMSNGVVSIQLHLIARD